VASPVPVVSAADGLSVPEQWASAAPKSGATSAVAKTAHFRTPRARSTMIHSDGTRDRVSRSRPLGDNMPAMVTWRPLSSGVRQTGRICAGSWACLLVVATAACAHPAEAPPPAQPTQFPQPAITGPSAREAPRESGQVGYATWYGAGFAGRKTADGERFAPNLMTAAHRTLPFGTWVEVQRVDTGESVRVRITDRGPWGHADRIIDLSRAAAKALRIVGQGLTMVRLRVVAGP